MHHADVIVIGGGVIGCSSAYYLAESSRSVLVLERDHLGEGASFGNAGHLTPGDAIPLAAPGVIGQALRWVARADSPFSMSWRLTPSYVSWLVNFARRSRRTFDARVAALKDLADLSLELVEAMPATERNDFEYRRAGVLNLYQSDEGLRSGVQAAETLRGHGIHTELLGPDQVREQGGFDGPVAGGVLFPDDAQCNPYAFVTRLAAIASARGAEFREGVDVRSVEAGATGFTIRTSAGSFSCATVVLAAGSGIPAIARSTGLKVPIVGGGGYSMDVAIAPAPRLPLLFHEHRIAVNEVGGRTRFAGLMEIGKESSSVNPRKADYLKRTARELFRGASFSDAGEVWSGIRPCSPDGVPIVGVAPGYPGLIVAGGHAMVGVTLSAGTGRLVADLASGSRPTISSRPFRLERF